MDTLPARTGVRPCADIGVTSCKADHGSRHSKEVQGRCLHVADFYAIVLECKTALPVAPGHEIWGLEMW
jgi:hypothetical protein